MKTALFDLDGVLVDVSKSYLVAIQKTVGFYLNMPVSLREIQAYRNRGGLNNDWDLTECMLKEKGRDIPKQTIIDVFQEFYLGEHFDGLIKSERWLFKRTVLEEVLRLCKTGIVTGRPRMETTYVLQRFGVTDCFSVVITMDDIPSGKNKPDPYGIKMGLKCLSSESGYYFGDTVDDMVAATRAKVTPIGVVAPGFDPVTQNEALLGYGASQVLDSINDALEVLS